MIGAATVSRTVQDHSAPQLAKLRRVWTELGRDDPLWAVLSRADKRGGRWDAEEFLDTGRSEIEAQMELLAQCGWPRQHRLALDFGCGAGRLSRALAAHFDAVIGMDVSPAMLQAARDLGSMPDNVRLIENASPQIEGVTDASVDLLYSCITLQHIPPSLAEGYVAEFLRVLAPGGVAVFQFVSGDDGSFRGKLFSRFSNRWLNPLRRVLWRRRSVFEMHMLKRERLLALLASDPALRLLEEREDGAAGKGWRSLRWSVLRESWNPKPARPLPP